MALGAGRGRIVKAAVLPAIWAIVVGLVAWALSIFLGEQKKSADATVSKAAAKPAQVQRRAALFDEGGGLR